MDIIFRCIIERISIKKALKIRLLAKCFTYDDFDYKSKMTFGKKLMIEIVKRGELPQFVKTTNRCLKFNALSHKSKEHDYLLLMLKVEGVVDVVHTLEMGSCPYWNLFDYIKCTKNCGILTKHTHIHTLNVGFVEVSCKGMIDVKCLHLQHSVLTNFDELEKSKVLHTLVLNYSTVSNLSALSNLHSLHILKLVGTEVTDITPLAGCTNLEVLHLQQTQVNNCNILGSLKKLHTLKLRHTEVSDASALTNVQNLDLSKTRVRDVTFAKNSNLHTLNLNTTDVSDVSSLINIHTLYLGDTQIDDAGVAILAKSTILDTLVLEATVITNVDALGSCTSLRRLDLSHCKSITDVNALGMCENLQILFLNSTSLLEEGITELRKSTSLCSLNLGDTNMEFCDKIPLVKELTLRYTLIKEISAMTGVISLDLSELMIDDISSLYGCTIEDLNLSKMLHLSDITPLCECKNLRTLCLNYTLVSDVKALKTCEKLRKLSLTRCHQFKDASGFESFPSLHTLYIDGTSVEDVSPLRRCETLRTLHISEHLSALTKATLKDVKIVRNRLFTQRVGI
ncbi:MAG TPA: leucine-rich repeat domain-containing protein [Nitrosarchaeum sp.]|nr:leucine-rich repeat domain-containing protein [Nitrosarchaeum sp.]